MDSTEMDHLQAFQNRFTKRILGNKLSSSEALNHLKWIPLSGRRFGHRCLVVQNAVKRDIPELLETFRSTLRDSTDVTLKIVTCPHSLTQELIEVKEQHIINV